MSFMPFTLEQLERALNTISIDPSEAGYIRTYREVLAYFSSFRTLTITHFVVGVQIVYGWMPTMLNLREPPDGYQGLVERLNQLRDGDTLTADDLKSLKATINNSVVGPSKLLHCLNPNNFAIWDSRVYRFIHHRVTQYQLAKPDSYLSYLSNCSYVAGQRGFASFHQAVNRKMEYNVSKLRAIEWVMYMKGNRRRPAT